MKASSTDHRTRVTKMMIRRAFTELLQYKPIQSISVKELCLNAGINRSTFYTHYTDIYDLLGDMETELLEDFEQALAPMVEASGTDITPLRITTGIFQCLKNNAEICAITLGPYGDKEFAAKIIGLGRERYFETYSAVFAGTTRKELDYYYAFVSAGCIGLLEKWIEDGLNTDAKELAAMCEGIMTEGIGFLKRERR